MSLGSHIDWDDTVLPFQLDDADIRGRFVRISAVLDDVLRQHDYPAAIEALVTEAVLLTALVGQTIKLRWKLSLQIRGNGAVKMIATDYFGPGEDGEPAKIRAYASFEPEQLDDASRGIDLFGGGFFGVLIDQGPGTEPYQGITPLEGGSLTACAEAYFAQSEQLPTRFKLAFGQSRLPGEAKDGWRAGGIMLQHMPKQSPHVIEETTKDKAEQLMTAKDLIDGEDHENWNRVNILLDTAEETEVVGPLVAPTDVLLRLFHEETPRVFDAQPVRFGCTCSAKRVQDSLAAYASEEIEDLVSPNGLVTADCQFCGAHYAFKPTELGQAANG